ncbi:MAG: hypothetical protein ACPG21_11160 [Crocinitomicaceae bacterium]
MGIGYGPGRNMHDAVNKQRKNMRKSGDYRSLSESLDQSKRGKSNPIKITDKKASPEQLEAIREKMLKTKKRNLIYMSIALGILFVFIIYITSMPTERLFLW